MEWMMRVRQVMQTKVQTVQPKMPVTELERELITHRVSGFPVVSHGRLVGLVTRSDIVRSLTVEHTHDDQLSDFYDTLSTRPQASPADLTRDMGARVGARFEGMTVEDVMSRHVHTADPDQSVDEVARMMVDHGVHRLPVVEEGNLVGIVTTLDLVRMIAEGRFEEA
jgi:CBS domain-containing protein